VYRVTFFALQNGAVGAILAGIRMNQNASHDDDAPQHAGGFATTRWSVVLASGQRQDTTADATADEALTQLCEAYWLPLYEFARRRGYSAADAGDVTQGFFAQLLEKHYLQSADPERGRFRSFLLTAFKRFLTKDREYHQAQKRGGGMLTISLDFARAESQYGLEPADAQTPERLFERRWAITLLDRVLKALEQEYTHKGKSDFFARCRNSLTGLGMDQQYAEIAAACGMTEASVKVAVHRMKARYRELLTAEVAQTLASDDEIADELRALMDAVAG